MVILLQASRRNIPILIDAESETEGLDDLLKLADYVVCSAKFPQASTCYNYKELVTSDFFRQSIFLISADIQLTQSFITAHFSFHNV